MLDQPCSIFGKLLPYEGYKMLTSSDSSPSIGPSLSVKEICAPPESFGVASEVSLHSYPQAPRAGLKKTPAERIAPYPSNISAAANLEGLQYLVYFRRSGKATKGTASSQPSQGWSPTPVSATFILSHVCSAPSPHAS